MGEKMDQFPFQVEHETLERERETETGFLALLPPSPSIRTSLDAHSSPPTTHCHWFFIIILVTHLCHRS